MSEAAFAKYTAGHIPAYAEDKIKSGQWQRDEALELSRRNFHELLPEGLATPDHHLFEICSDDETVGALWFAVLPRGKHRTAYVYDVLVYPPHQGQGHGTRAFRALEDFVKERGLAGIALQVFGHNPGAQKLYRRLGFYPTNIHMFKSIAPR